MELKVKLMNFFLIGSLLLQSYSCKKIKVEKDLLNKYKYINETNKEIRVKIYGKNNVFVKDDIILVGDTLSYDIISEGGAGPFQFGSPMHGDSIYLTFSNEKFIVFRRDFDSIFFEKSYKKLEINEHENILFYTFTYSDYLAADSIQ